MESNEQFSFPNYLNRQQEQGGINLKSWLFKVLAIWPWLIASLILSFSVVFTIHRYSTPRYLVNASILIQGQESTSGREFLEEMNLFSAKVNVENEIALLKSWSFVKEVVDSLDFEVEYYKPGRIKSTEIYDKEVPFEVAIIQNESVLNGNGFNVQLLGGGRFRVTPSDDNPVPGLFDQPLTSPAVITGNGYTLRVSLKNQVPNSVLNTYEVKVYDPNELAKLYRSSLHVTSGIKANSLLSISYESHHIIKAKDFINKLIEFYIKKELEDKNLTAVRTIDFIDRQLSSIQDSLNTIEDRLQIFRANNNIVDMSQKGAAVLQEIQELERSKSAEEIKLNYFDYLLGYLRETRNPTSVVSPATVGVDSPILLALINNLNELSAQLSQMEMNATEVNPQVQSLMLQIARVMEGIIDNVENLQKSTKITLANLERRIESAELKMNELPQTERTFVGIQRNFDLSESLFLYLQEKRAEAGIAKASNVPKTKLIDPALVSGRTYPDKKQNYLIALLIGLGLPIGFLVGKSYLDKTIHSVQDIEQRTDLPVLGTLAYSHSGTEFVVQNHPKSLAAETFRKLRASMKYLEQKKPIQTVMVTSFLSGDGKTFSSINIATMMADMGKKTILLGMDLRKQKLHESYNVSNKYGMSNVLIRDKSWKEVLHHTSVRNLDLVTGGPVPPNPNELIASDEFENLMQELKIEYDCIIVDTPPVGLVSDAIEMAKMVDITLFIMRHDYTPDDAIDFITDVSNKNLIQNIGLVLNGVDFQKLKNRQDHRYGYGYGYGVKNKGGYYET